jgi:hypothetical protein
MVQLDHGLINRARILITDANVNRTETLIFDYLYAVLLHEEKASEHVRYQKKYEKRLRRFAEQESERRAKHNRHLHERNRAALRVAAHAMDNADRVEARCLALDERVNAALLFGKDGFSSTRP